MRIGYWFMLVALPCLLELSTAAWSDEPTRPFWTEQATFRFDDELFFTGRASCSPRAEEGDGKPMKPPYKKC
jgi:hypothetical protein